MESWITGTLTSYVESMRMAPSGVSVTKRRQALRADVVKVADDAMRWELAYAAAPSTDVAGEQLGTVHTWSALLAQVATNQQNETILSA